MLDGEAAPALQHFSVIRREQSASTPEQRKPLPFGSTAWLCPPCMHRDFPRVSVRCCQKGQFERKAQASTLCLILLLRSVKAVWPAVSNLVLFMRFVWVGGRCSDICYVTFIFVYFKQICSCTCIRSWKGEFFLSKKLLFNWISHIYTHIKGQNSPLSSSRLLASFCDLFLVDWTATLCLRPLGQNPFVK